MLRHQNGSGALTVTSNYKHRIVSKDELVITGGNYTVTAEKDAINGKDCVKIKDGVFTLSSATGDSVTPDTEVEAVSSVTEILVLTE
jgi:predicted RecA/RadA family phage recombinase